MQKNLALLAKYFKKLYKPTNNNLRTSLNSRNKTEDTTPRYNNDNQSGQFGNQRKMTVAGARETVGSQVVQQNGIQCFNCKGFGHYAKECRKPKRVKDYTYHKEKMMMCKQAEQGVPLQAEQADWLEDTDEEIDEQELEAHYSFMAKIQEVLPEESSSTDQPLEQILPQWEETTTLEKDRVNHSTSVIRPPLKSYQVKDKVVPNNSQVKFTKKENSRTSNVNVCIVLMWKNLVNSNHDARVYKILERHTTIQKPKSYFKELYENTNKAWKWWIEKKCPSKYKWTQTTPSRPSLKWKPMGRIFSNVRLRWIPQKVISTLSRAIGTSFNGQKQQRIDLNADALYNVKQENLRAWLLKMLISKKPVPECSSLVLHQMTSDHNRSELGILVHSNDPSSSKLVPKVVPLAVKTATSRQELELLFHHHMAMLRTTEHPSDTFVFTMKMEILLESTSNKLSVAFKMRHSMRMLVKDCKNARGIDAKDNVRRLKVKFEKHEETSLQQRTMRKPRPHELNDESNLIDLMKECCQ
ncbi:hypothetical protein Tco_1548746 [Tanacetum coccineum]